MSGFTGICGVGLKDIERFNRLIPAGRRVKPLPDPVYCHRSHPTTSMPGMIRDRLRFGVNHFRRRIASA